MTRTSLLAVLVLAVAGLFAQVGPGVVGGQPAMAAEEAAGSSAADSDDDAARSVEIRASDHVLGDPDAPVAIVEYTSLTCPHCADFHTGILPKLRREWIEPGKAKLVYRHFPLDTLSLAAALLANCFDDDRFFEVVGTLFARQADWARAEQPVQVLREITRSAGMADSTFDRCVSDQGAADQILADRKTFAQQVGIQATPTFMIHGQRIQGARSYETFHRALEQALQEAR
ncbi:MAG: DsbA family protein [Rhodovibrio sp.]|nr:DsbA family protein [Rhodovibrio sp.]